MVERAGKRPRAELAERLEAIARRGIQTAAHHLAALLPAAQPAPAPGEHLATVDELPERIRAIS
jgi:hypothetical protein